MNQNNNSTKENNKKTKKPYKAVNAKRPAAKKTNVKNNKNSGNKKTQYKKKPYYTAQKKKTEHKPQKPAVKIAFLGGLNEIGKNITIFECMGDMVMLDCGMAFPDGDMLGVDLVIPDFTYVEQNKDRLKGIIITHAHEDHIGGLPYLLGKVNVPIYSTSLTNGIIGNKLKEHSLPKPAELVEIKPGERIKLGCMEVE